MTLNLTMWLYMISQLNLDFISNNFDFNSQCDYIINDFISHNLALYNLIWGRCWTKCV